ncbi:PREDICTED: LOW QUALITY PROTEIN: protein FAM189A2 [Apaloderma vittatum]|uniref:LOW QUALITY PROTEIN: protein FAM189A2 n=1 Tax=Apaloderma vittatum TaxID=57397 RepID=UPI000521C5CA|nr:PREDICTED: LOW QUALITY PROTEIN: protein FAM189A2 [Apaloderma vittatum]
MCSFRVAGVNSTGLSLEGLSPATGSVLRDLWFGDQAILSGVLNIGTWKKPVIFLANLFITLSVVCFMMSLSGFVLGYHGLQHVPNISRCDFNVFIALCVLNGITTAVCMLTTAVQYLRILANRRTFLNESDAEDQDVSLESHDFVSSVLHHNYFAAFYSSTPQLDHRTCREWNEDVAVLCRLDLPPPYEAAWVQNSSEQEGAPQVSVAEVVDLGEVSDRQASQGVVLSCQAETQAEVKQLYATTLQKSLREITLRGKLQFLIDCKSSTDTKQFVAWILDQFCCSMNPDIIKLMDNTNSVLKSDEKHMAEVTTSATFLKQVMASDQQAMSLRAHGLPFRMLPGLLHLETCGDLSTFTIGAGCLAETNIQRAEHERPHNLSGIVRETVL